MEKVRKLENSPELNVDITLLYCLPKGDKLDLVIQKATEIGVKNIVLVQSSRCVCKFKKEDFDKYRDLLVERVKSEWKNISFLPLDVVLDISMFIFSFFNSFLWF